MSRHDPFADFDRRFAADQRRFEIAHRIILTLIVLIWLAVIAAGVVAVVTLVRLGPDGIAREAGRFAGNFERAWEQAR